MYGNWSCHIYEIRRVSEPPGGAAVKGVILRKGERAYSYFSGVLSAIFPAVVERNWLITGYENYPEALEPYGGNLGREAFFWVPGSGWRRLSGSRIIRGTGASCRDLRKRFRCAR